MGNILRKGFPFLGVLSLRQHPKKEAMRQARKNPLLSAAKHYIKDFNWSVVPMFGKQPATKWTRWQDLKPTTRQVSGMFSISGITGLGLIPGKISGNIRVRDFDNPGAYKFWSELYPELASSLPTVRTARGFHVYFRADIEDKVTVFEDGELRAGAGLVVLPPSIHPDGQPYEWLIPPAADFPYIDDMTSAGLLGPLKPIPETDPNQLPEPVLEAITKTLPTGPGQRHNKLFKFARPQSNSRPGYICESPQYVLA